jgi:dsRNA-specific ribonuclease
VCEAWIAYLWHQFGRNVADRFIEIYLYPYHHDTAAIRGKSYKSLLQERVQKTYQQLPVYVEEE